MGDQVRTENGRIRAAVRKAHAAACWRDFVRARVYILVGVLVVATVVVFASEPRREVGSVQGHVIAINQVDSRWPNPLRTITVRLDDGRTAVVSVRGGFPAEPNARVRLRETEHRGWWRRTTFRLDRTETKEEGRIG